MWDHRGALNPGGAALQCLSGLPTAALFEHLAVLQSGSIPPLIFDLGTSAFAVICVKKLIFVF